MPKLHAELESFFDAHKAKTGQCKRKAHDELSRLMATLDEIAAHFNDLTSKLTAAELASHDHAIDGKMEWMHTRLRAGGTCVDEMRAALRRLARVSVEIEQGFDQDHRETLMWAGAQMAPPQ
jgi:hypothetical protein